MNALLAIAGLDVSIAGQPVLKSISLDLELGSITTVLGANGVGKTSLLRAISHIYLPSAGSITFDGQVITHLPPHEIVARGLCHAPEGRQIFAQMSVLENLQVGAGRCRGSDLALRLQHVYSLFPRLQERSRQSAGSMSGGEQQMLSIGRALMSKPKLLLLDEPSLGLAPIIVAQLFNLIKQIAASGVSILLIEQNARAALAVSDFAYVLDAGRIVLSGDAKALRQDVRVQSAYLGG